MKVYELIEELKKCNPNSDVEISVDVSTNENTFGHRVFGEVCEVIHNMHPTASILVEMTSKNF